MSTLLLLRHAKSSWEGSTPDHERPLAPRGVAAAQRIRRHFEDRGIRPSVVLCSTARRTRATLDAIRPALGDAVEVRYEDGLYGADAGEILVELRALDAATPSVLVVGHNPGLEDLARGLAGGGDGSALAQLDTKFPTGALASLELERPWAELDQGAASLVSLVLPRDLPD